jgi:NadR type nicotinamide-nucleotide adenylyltransferase
MTWRVVITGSECTGKTTLARAVAAELGAPWVAEPSRAYAESRDGALSAADVEPIAHATAAAHDAALAGTPAELVLDTDLVSTVVYARAYYGECPGWIADAAAERRGDLYLLCEPDLPWVADGVRDRPGADARMAMHHAFTAALGALGVPFVAVRGAGPSRIDAAVAAVIAARNTRPLGAPAR